MRTLIVVAQAAVLLWFSGGVPCDGGGAMLAPEQRERAKLLLKDLREGDEENLYRAMVTLDDEAYRRMPSEYRREYYACLRDIAISTNIVGRLERNRLKAVLILCSHAKETRNELMVLARAGVYAEPVSRALFSTRYPLVYEDFKKLNQNATASPGQALMLTELWEFLLQRASSDMSPEDSRVLLGLRGDLLANYAQRFHELRLDERSDLLGVFLDIANGADEPLTERAICNLQLIADRIDSNERRRIETVFLNILKRDDDNLSEESMLCAVRVLVQMQSDKATSVAQELLQRSNISACVSNFLKEAIERATEAKKSEEKRSGLD